MGLLNLFGGDSSSSSTTSATNSQQGADNGSQVLRSDVSLSKEAKNYGNITIGSDGVAQAAIAAASESSTHAIENTQNVLQQATSFLEDALSGVFNLVDHRAASADQNLQAAQSLAESVVTKSQQTDTDSVIRLVTILAAAGVAILIFKK
jgi:hypothetical protein